MTGAAAACVAKILLKHIKALFWTHMRALLIQMKAVLMHIKALLSQILSAAFYILRWSSKNLVFGCCASHAKFALYEHHLNLPLFRSNTAIAWFLEHTALLHERLTHAVAIFVIVAWWTIKARGTQPTHNQIHNQTKWNLISNKACRALQEHVDEQSRAKTITIIVFFHGNIRQQLFLCDFFLGNAYLRRIKNTAIDKRDSNPAFRTLKLFSMLADAFAR